MTHAWKPSHAFRISFLLITVALLLTTTGCSTFEHDWQAGANEAGGGLVGRWDGTWSSEKSSHNGRLRCILTPAEDGRYDAHFHAVYGGILTFEHIVKLEAGKENTNWKLTGREDLGWLAGGRYHYDGTVTGDAFKATYRCESDNGLFEMQRVK